MKTIKSFNNYISEQATTGQTTNPMWNDLKSELMKVGGPKNVKQKDENKIVDTLRWGNAKLPQSQRTEGLGITLNSGSTVLAINVPDGKDAEDILTQLNDFDFVNVKQKGQVIFAEYPQNDATVPISAVQSIVSKYDIK
jgi:hypothetical protein